jgi:gag-polypeptide of LTR copia-type
VKKIIDIFSLFYFSSSDNPGMLISSCILKGENYDMQVKVMRNVLRAKNKLEFIDGSITKSLAEESEASL